MDKQILQYMPPMLMDEDLNVSLQILPEYDSCIIDSSRAERLIALQDIYSVYIPTRMSREIYSKLYLSLMRSLQKKQSLIAVKQSNENSKLIRHQSYESILGGADSFTVIGQSGIGKSCAISRSVRLLMNDNFIEIDNTKIIP